MAAVDGAQPAALRATTSEVNLARGQRMQQPLGVFVTLHGSTAACMPGNLTLNKHTPSTANDLPTHPWLHVALSLPPLFHRLALLPLSHSPAHPPCRPPAKTSTTQPHHSPAFCTAVDSARRAQPAFCAREAQGHRIWTPFRTKTEVFQGVACQQPNGSCMNQRV